MTQTEPTATDQAEQTPRFAIIDDYDAHPGSSQTWRVDVVFDVEGGRVVIQDRWGNGTPAREYHRVNVRLATGKGGTYASMTPMVDYLESDQGQELLTDLAEGHEVVWDGSDHVGRLSDAAVTALERLQDQLMDLFPDLPSYWSAEEWFAGCRTADLTGRESDTDLAELARTEVAGAMPDYHLQEADVLAYLTEQRNQLAADGVSDQGEACIISATWYDRPNEPTGWHVEVLRRDANGDHFVATDSENVTFPVAVDRFDQADQAELTAALLVAFPGAEVRLQ